MSEEFTQVVYCGPNIQKYGLMQYQVYMGLPYNVKEAVQDIPEIRELLVPVSRLESVRKSLRKAGTLENKLYEQIRGKV